MRRVFAALIASAVLAGCGSSSSGHAYRASDASLPSCAKALQPGRAIDLPSGYPHAFPFPKGTLIAHTNSPSPGQVWIYGYVPSDNLRTTVTFFRTELVKAGFHALGYDGDNTDDSGERFRGHGVTGQWYIQHVKGCGVAHFTGMATKSG